MQKLEMRDHISKALIEPIEVGLAFPSAPRTAFTSDGGVALDLVYQTAEAVRDIEDRAYETEQHARTIAERAVEKLRVAGVHSVSRSRATSGPSPHPNGRRSFETGAIPCRSS